MNAKEAFDALWYQVKTRSGDSWDKITQARKNLLQDIVADIADLTVRALSGENVAKEKAIADASLDQFGPIGARMSRDIVWSSVGEWIIGILPFAAEEIRKGLYRG